MTPRFSRLRSRRRFLAGLGAGVTAVSAWGLSPLITSGEVPRDRPRIVGHRGAEGLAPPNTRAGVRRALEVGVDGVELDIRETADGELLLFHDPVLDWDSSGTGWVQNTDWDDIRGSEIDGEPLIRLSEALELIEDADRELSLYAELKEGGYTDQVLETVADYGLLDRLTVISFSAEVIEPAQEAGIPTGLVGSAPTPWLTDDAAAAGADIAFAHYAPHALPRFVRDTQEEGLTAGVWKLIDTEQTIRDAIEAGADIVVTNYPDKALEILEHH
ncbi:glycerophosphodiester phosphodiesterase [Halostagnicola bangensis]